MEQFGAKEALLVDRKVGDLNTGFFKVAAGVEHALVLDLSSDDMVLGFAIESDKAFEGGVVAFGGA